MSIPSSQQPANQSIFTYIEQRGSSGGILENRHVRVSLPADRASRERVFAAGVQSLPIVPNLIDHLHNRYIRAIPDGTANRTNRVMKEEHGICEMKQLSVSRYTQSTAVLSTI